MIEIKYTGDALWARIERAVEIVKERLRRVTNALNEADISYAVIGGNAVQHWVAQVDESVVRKRKGVRSLFTWNEIPYTPFMPRTPRICPAGEIFHVLNRAVARLQIFEKPEDYEAFLRVVDETSEIVALPIYSMIAMPNHWHFVVQPTNDKQVSEFFRRLTVTHSMRWHAHYKTSGSGHLYQGRFKSFPIQDDEHLLWVMRYVERNALRANFVETAEQWKWGTAHLRRLAKAKRPKWLQKPAGVDLPRNWRSLVNKPMTEKEAEAIKRCMKRGSPFGDEKWVTQSAARLGLESTLRRRGRPRSKE